jgi:hypothetical protein
MSDLPEYPPTKHLPWKPNASRDDLIASDDEAKVIFSAERLSCEEKMDGANVGVALGPTIRNRRHILRKGYPASTPAKRQFVPLWNWYYENVDRFQRLEKAVGTCAVYGEWLWATHTIFYDKLPEYLMPFDVWITDAKRFMDPFEAYKALSAAGFSPVPVLRTGPFKDYTELEALVQQESLFVSGTPREGAYLKIGDGTWLTHRFKMVRPGFAQHEGWNEDVMRRNRLWGRP